MMMTSGSTFARFACSTIGLLLFAGYANAYTVTQLSEFAGGNPGDLCDTVGGETCIPVLEFGGVLQGNSIDLTWDFDGSGILGTDLVPDFPTISSTGNLTFTSITTTSMTLDITLNNTTNPLLNPAGFTASIISMGIELDGFASGVLSLAGSFLDTYDEDNIAGGPGLNTDFCASTNAACNSGAEADGIVIGDSDTIQFVLTGTFDPTLGITFRNAATKWQSNYDELVDEEVAGGNSSFEQPGLPAGYVPEPSTGLLVALGLTGLCGVRRGRAEG
jgi:hypothetical protein